MKEFNTFVWWQGRVEDRDDPLNLGRCRVRMLGFHSQNIMDIPTSTLPWAYPAMPINSNPGDPAIGPTVGTWVMGFFRDGQDAQEPIMTHIVDAGFTNEDDVVNNLAGNSPEWGGKKSIVTDEVNTNRLAKGNPVATYVQDYTTKHTGETVEYPSPAHGFPNPSHAVPIPVPGLGYNADYPNNKVEESDSGHVTEVDDTPGSERLSKVHKSGTLEVIKSDGSKVVKVVGDDFEMVLSDKTLKVSGNLNIVSDGDINFKAGGTIRFDSNTQFRITAPIASVIDSPLIVLGPEKGGFVNVNGAISQVGSPLVLPGIPIPVPDLPEVSFEKPEPPDTIELGK